eukprot:COSAG01_NODE_817_length_13376_cov_2.970101_10_plen_71_part_00
MQLGPGQSQLERPAYKTGNAYLCPPDAVRAAAYHRTTVWGKGFKFGHRLSCSGQLLWRTDWRSAPSVTYA